MRVVWEGLYEAIENSIASLEMERQFEAARRGVLELEPFAKITTLLEFLKDKNSSPETRNVLYRALVHAVQIRTPWAPLATRIMWCGLWPSLDVVYRRQRRYFVDEPEELSSLISVVFTAEVSQLDLQSVRRVAVTLIRSTAREVVRVRRRQLARWAPAEPMRAEHSHDTSQDGYPDGQVPVADELLSALGDLPDPRGASHSVLGFLPGLSMESQVAAIYHWLHRAVGDDAGLFLAIAVFEEQPEDVAAQLGLSHAALRKRLQKIRTRLVRLQSQNATQTGMSLLEGPHKKPAPSGDD